MHWAAHGSTAAEVIDNRIDAGKPHLGLTSFKDTKPSKEDIKIAKNYLNEEELNILNRVVTAYLEVAELQALNRKPMYMKDWIARLDDFLKMTGNDILQNPGSISHEGVLQKSDQEYQTYKENSKNELSRIEKDFVQFIGV